ncbi:hypothetical protein OG963_14820 [Streptomyces sp. NBC_01707]|uniref:hypothetical protein n=1 Tax=Streptomyces sp. NBC_01707 TaxID=2975914 RepID=UPI00352D5ADB
MGWHKRLTHPVRRAPQLDQDPQYNWARCVHVPYIEEGCRTVNCPEAPRGKPTHPAGYAPAAAS